MRQTRIGLALGAGAAKGWAHIGVINALQRAGIQAEVVAGSSVGALVGGAWASDRLPALESWVRAFRYWDVIRLMDFSWRRGGLLRGDRVFSHVRQIVSETDIRRCRHRFGAVATNLSTGRELWLTKGDLHVAMRASCSMPGLLPAVNLNGYWLVDGAVVNPVPVSLTRALGADIVIAVDLQHDAHLIAEETLSVTPQETADEPASSDWRSRLRQRFTQLNTRRAVTPPGAMQIMSTSIQMLENRLKRHRMAGDPPDVLLQPLCPQIATLDFHRAGEAIAAGELAVEKKMDELLALIRQ
ncbi:patatin-like phospholipase RssA [Pantoea sp. 1.19]|uniref:patatin-like phospholipase RssA n=1 Tax=Pantoea sp. 1.19 TaxID=1925589 RepID=UPI0009491956|nr:patatin-like phospholipase RssA [Pantoea sp. 1.19]